MIKKGIYQELINVKTKGDMEEVSSNFVFEKDKIEPSESSDILGKYIGIIVEKALKQIKGDDKVSKQIEICNKIIRGLSEEVDKSLYDQIISKEAEILLSVIDKLNSELLKKEKTVRPITGVYESSLFTGAINEPSLGSELKKEIPSSDSIDILVSFIRWSGLRVIMSELEEFTKTRKLRVITTSYMGATEFKAIEFLAKLPNTKVKISYDTNTTRLHAKSYCFRRESGFTTAYIGSSNLSRAAMSSGLEWNLKISEKTSKPILDKFDGTFESYWNSEDFKLFDYKRDKEKLNRALKMEKIFKGDNENKTSYSFDIYPYPFQQEILDKLTAERKIHNNFKNLIVAATGTGKTVVSAFDYKNFCMDKGFKSNKLLFVAHREEILKQSLACFRGIMKDGNFASLFTGNCEPDQLDYIFASIQTLNSKKIYEKLPSDYYDYIVIDESHHAPANSYQKILDYFKPAILLGLTATPERMDEEDVLKYFDNKITAEIRLGEAINRKLLSPFQYFGVSDNVDLSHLKWERGGYNINQLTNLYTKDKQRVGLITKAIEKYTSSVDEIKGLGFCVSREHGKFMNERFNEIGIPSINLDSNSTREERNSAKSKLISGKIKFIFVVDLYNEGVDIPEINTVLFLRPTESLTIFLQQLGRGLRLSEGKECLTVLDFIGQAHKNYNFEERLRGIIGKTKHSTREEIINNFPNVPKGCYINLERIARDRILSNINGFIINKRNLKAKIKNFKNVSERELNLTNFINHYQLQLGSIYKSSSFKRLCVEVGVKPNFYDRDEKELTKGMMRLTKINSIKWIDSLIEIFASNLYKTEENLSQMDKKMLLMLHYTLFQDTPLKMGMKNMVDIVNRIKSNKILVAEMIELFKIKREKIDFIEKTVNLGYPSPLTVNSSYSRDQILSALGDYTLERKPSRREGVIYIKNLKTDVLFVTLNKTEKDYSPSTMYKDYAIDKNLFHWQSQSTTPEGSETGKRYINHKKMDNKILLFVREDKKEDGIASNYFFLGKVNYLSHKGSRPMNIIWKLEIPMIEKLRKQTSLGVNVG